MSIRAMIWAMDQETGSATRKLVLIKLCDNADERTGECYPSVGTIARICECSRRTAQRHLRQLEDDGYISTVRFGGRDGNGNNVSAKYRINGKWQSKENQGRKDDTPADGLGASFCHVGASFCHDRGVIMTPKPVNEPVIEPTSKETRRAASKPLRSKIDLPEWMPTEKWGAYLETRKAKRRPMNAESLVRTVSAIEKVLADGYSLDDVLEAMISTGWQTVKSEYMDNWLSTNRKELPTPEQEIEVLAAYHEILPELPAVSSMGWDRSETRDNLHRIWNSDDRCREMGFWTPFFYAVREKAWMTGNQGQPAEYLRLAWLLKENTFKAVITKAIELDEATA